METTRELKKLFGIVAVFATIFFLPLDSERFRMAIDAAFDLAKWYAREHVLLCLLPAFLIAGAVAVFISQGAVLKCFGANAKKWVSYFVAAVSGCILAVCSCTILPLFTSIYKRGAGLGPAVAFLYSGPAISILSIILTVRILGTEMGVARVMGAMVSSVVIGLIMSFIFRDEEKEKQEQQMNIMQTPQKRSTWQTLILLFVLILILVVANWGAPSVRDTGAWMLIYTYKWYIVGALSLMLCWLLVKVLHLRGLWVTTAAVVTVVSAALSNMFQRSAEFAPSVSMIAGVAGLSLLLLFDKQSEENREWAFASWGFAKQIMPLLAVGVMGAAFLLGSSHGNTSIPGVVPYQWIQGAVGDNSLFPEFFASIAGAFMYFATLTEVPIIQGLLDQGMGRGAALSLLLAGPSLSLPSMLVLRSALGTLKTSVYVVLVVALSTLAGLIYGAFA